MCVQVLAGYAFSFLILCEQTLNVVDVAIVDVSIAMCPLRRAYCMTASQFEAI